MLCIIGCGNPTRSDDGVGVHVAQQLRAQLPAQAGVQVYDTGTNGMEVMFKARGARRLILIDAANSGSTPGALFEVPGAEFQAPAAPHYSQHSFRWEDALSAGRTLFGAEFAQQTTVYLIEAETLAFGLNLSPPVQAAAQRLIERLLAEIAATPLP